jgi:hypothetical protein
MSDPLDITGAHGNRVVVVPLRWFTEAYVKSVLQENPSWSRDGSHFVGHVLRFVPRKGKQQQQYEVRFSGDNPEDTFGMAVPAVMQYLLEVPNSDDVAVDQWVWRGLVPGKLEQKVVFHHDLKAREVRLENIDALFRESADILKGLRMRGVVQALPAAPITFQQTAAAADSDSDSSDSDTDSDSDSDSGTETDTARKVKMKSIRPNFAKGGPLSVKNARLGKKVHQVAEWTLQGEEHKQAKTYWWLRSPNKSVGVYCGLCAHPNAANFMHFDKRRNEFSDPEYGVTKFDSRQCTAHEARLSHRMAEGAFLASKFPWFRCDVENNTRMCAVCNIALDSASIDTLTRHQHAAPSSTSTATSTPESAAVPPSAPPASTIFGTAPIQQTLDSTELEHKMLIVRALNWLARTGVAQWYFAVCRTCLAIVLLAHTCVLRNLPSLVQALKDMGTPAALSLDAGELQSNQTISEALATIAHLSREETKAAVAASEYVSIIIDEASCPCIDTLCLLFHSSFLSAGDRCGC